MVRRFRDWFIFIPLGCIKYYSNVMWKSSLRIWWFKRFWPTWKSFYNRSKYQNGGDSNTCNLFLYVLLSFPPICSSDYWRFSDPKNQPWVPSQKPIEEILQTATAENEPAGVATNTAARAKLAFSDLNASSGLDSEVTPFATRMYQSSLSIFSSCLERRFVGRTLEQEEKLKFEREREERSIADILKRDWNQNVWEVKNQD